MDELDRGLAGIRWRATICYGLIALYVATSFLMAGVFTHMLVDLPVVNQSQAELDLLALSALGFLISYGLSIIFIGMWIHRAHANLFAAGLTGLEFTPGWSIGWFFIPFANLVMPYRAMRELWERCPINGRDLPYVLLWWISFVVGGIVSNIGERIASDEAPSNLFVVIGASGHILSAILLFVIIRKVTTAQHSGLHAADTFA